VGDHPEETIGNIKINGGGNSIMAINDNGNLNLSSSTNGDITISSKGKTFTWPDSFGAIGQILTTDSSGGLIWTNASVGTVTANADFTTNNSLVRVHGTAGQTIQQSDVILDDNNTLSGLSRLEIDTSMRLDGNTISAINVDGNINISSNGNGSVLVNNLIVNQNDEISGITKLTVDNIVIDSTNIGLSTDLDLITLSDSKLTIAGELETTTLNIGGVGITSSPAEINLLDGLLTTTSELNVLDGNTIATATTLESTDSCIVNDNGIMQQVELSDFNTYFSSSLTSLPNVETIGTLTDLNVSDISLSTGSISSTGALSLSVGTNDDLTLSAGDSGDLKLSSRGTTYTLPTTDGSANDVLITNGSGIT
jgi:hypothetical protein